ncbi:MAG: succinate dehydrogenase, hydrophobic membrane anchor protein [Steroidobacteraceae bacterium]
MSLRSPVGRVLGTGPAGHGSGRWWAQRVSAAALIPLCLWFVCSLLALPALDFGAAQTWLALPWNGFLAALLVAVLTCHSYLGTVEVVEDWVHGAAVKITFLLLLQCIYVLTGGASLYAILRVALGTRAP